MSIEILPTPAPSTATGNTPEAIKSRDGTIAKILGKRPTDNPQLIEIGKHVKRGLKQRQNLSAARLKAAEVRKEAAMLNRPKLEKAIADLFDRPDKPGWGWDNKQIVKFLVPTFKGTYEPSTILKVVKLEAAKNRRTAKNRLIK